MPTDTAQSTIAFYLPENPSTLPISHILDILKVMVIENINISLGNEPEIEVATRYIEYLESMMRHPERTTDQVLWAELQLTRIERVLPSLNQAPTTATEVLYRGMLQSNPWQQRYFTPINTPVNTRQSTSRQQQSNACRFCEETITPNIANACAECLAESSSSCYVCHASIPEGQANSVITSHDNYEMLCRNCYGNRVHCTNCSNLIQDYVSTENDCRICQRIYCLADLLTHSCNSHMSMPYRPYSRNKYKGSDKLAESIKINRLVGVELEAVNGNPSGIGRALSGNIGISDDGSLKGKNGIELQTPASSCNELEEYIRNATTTLKDAGYKTNKSCGLHIHIDGSDFSKNGRKIFQLLNTYYVIEPIILSMLPKSRRNNAYAMPLKRWFSQLKIQELISNKRMSIKRIEQEWYKTKNSSELNRYKRNKYDNSRYHGLNLHALLSGGHYEIRYHQGTINQKKITNWINFHLAILDWSLKNYSKEVLDNIQNETDVNAKARKMNRYFKFDKGIARYVRKQIRKFSSIDEEPEE